MLDVSSCFFVNCPTDAIHDPELYHGYYIRSSNVVVLLQFLGILHKIKLIVLYCIVSYRIVSYRIVLYRTVSHRIVSYCIAVPPAQPEIQDHPNGSVVKVPHEQETINFTCTCSNGKPAATITWLRNGEPVVDNVQNFTTVLDNKLENSKSILTVHPQHEDNGAIYTCRAINDAIRKPLDAVVVLSVMRECGIEVFVISGFSVS